MERFWSRLKRKRWTRRLAVLPAQSGAAIISQCEVLLPGRLRNPDPLPAFPCGL